MLAALTLVTLTVATPAELDPTVRVRCEGCVLIAQQDAPTTPPPPATTIESSDREIQQRILAINHELRGIDVNWPSPLVLLAYAGYITGAVGLNVLVYALIGIFPSSFLIAGGVMLAAGVAAAVTSWVVGTSITSERKQQRETLIREREILEEELRFRRSDRGVTPTVMTEPVRPLITVAVF